MAAQKQIKLQKTGQYSTRWNSHFVSYRRCELYILIVFPQYKTSRPVAAVHAKRIMQMRCATDLIALIYSKSAGAL